jgi:tRNA (guanine37-N1)-methyltransferase
LLGKARAAGLIEVDFVDPRDHTTDKHRSVDDTPYGGGPGMVMKAEPLLAALEAAGPGDKILMAPVGAPLTQRKVAELAGRDHLVLICGRYEGIDERVIESAVDEIVSLGDYVVSGGEAPAMALIDAVSRLVPGVLGDAASTEDESFSAGLLEYPQYTRPSEIEGRAVPEVLLSGNHEKIRAWRRARSLERTRKRRPDLFVPGVLRDEDRRLDPIAASFGADRCYAILLHHPVLDRTGEVVTSSVTNLDIHDIARSATTYGLAGYIPVTPVATQREKIAGMAETWREIARREASPEGAGKARRGRTTMSSDNRHRALAVIDVAASLDDALALIAGGEGRPVRAIATSARPQPELGEVDHAALRAEILASDGRERWALVFGTGWGIAPEALGRCERVLSPILGSQKNASDFNHLSVRSAVGITLDRLFGDCSFAAT